MQCNFEKTGTTDGTWYSTKCINKAEILITNDPCYGLCYACAYQKLQAEKEVLETNRDTAAQEYKDLQAEVETLRKVLYRECPEKYPDNCKVCNGVNLGVRGNENIIDGIVTCDYCHAKSMQALKENNGKHS